MSKTPDQEAIGKISIHDFYFEKPLYEEIRIEDFEEDIFNGEVDAYSSLNHIDTTYEINSSSHIGINLTQNIVIHKSHNTQYDGLTSVRLNCKRKNNESLVFYLLVDEETITKIGQYPSLADIQFAEIGKRYDKDLEKEDLKNLKTAIGLNAYGVGAGAFVYLRRIFENLILETYNNHKSMIAPTEKGFENEYMSEKIKILKDYLPSQLIKMKSLYGILSKGVHELPEEDCLKYFSLLKLCIELILDQKIKMRQELEREKKVADELAAMSQMI